MERLVPRLARNLERLRAEIATTARTTGRDPTGIELVAVSKYATLVETEALVHAMVGLGMPPILGESRVQALTQKAAELAGGPAIRWDLVGSLQRNKAAQAASVFARIHSLDREEILRHLDRVAAAQGRTIEGFLQVNVSGEAAKHGFDPEDLPAALDLVASLPRIEVRGLMGMGPRGADHQTARPAFARLRDLAERSDIASPQLSMGMSGDYKGAILEGATVLRIGSALFADNDGGP